LLEQLAFIQSKTGVSFTIPEHDISFEVAHTIAATAHVLKTGHALFQAKPWISVSSLEQAKGVLKSFESGEPLLTALQFAGQEVVIFGTRVPLGPVVFFCDRAYITKEDLETLRRGIEGSAPGDLINIRFTPFEECPIDARYHKWIPADEAVALEKLLAPRDDKPDIDEIPWELPPIDVNEAIALLQSWCAVDPQQQEEQRETWEYLKTALDEDRLSDRKLFA
jgi:hypothetical protein